MPVAPARGMEFQSSGPLHWAQMLAPHIQQFAEARPGMRVLDVGSGPGYWAGYFAGQGCTVVGIDPSESGVRVAREAVPAARFECLEVSRRLLDDLGEDPFDLVISTEVLEHLYDPPSWAAGCFGALAPDGRLVGSTPYHGWLKNVAIAVSGKSDFHHDALRVGGHIKFFSNHTLRQLLNNAGFAELQLQGAGRLPFLWRSTVFCAIRTAPASSA